MTRGHKSNRFLERSFWYSDIYGEWQEVSPYDLLKQGKSLVILGDPGIGKTSYLKHLHRSSEKFTWVPPATLIRDTYRFKPKNPDQYLVIDGIDELVALQETDILHSILSALAKINYPKFVISCRSAEWKHLSSSRQFANDYDEPPELLTLQGINRQQALNYLSESTTERKARTILDHLDKVNLPQFYHNPLNLNLVLEILGNGEKILMTSKYDLYHRASKILLSEHRDTVPSPLGKLSIDDAFNSAGAICASLLVTGKKFVTTDQPISHRDYTQAIDVSEIVCLPKASKAKDVINSPLFKVADDSLGFLVPYHRSIAEFLAAYWLANALNNQELSRHRFLQSIMVEAQFPASLRGMCSWLACYDNYSDKIIETNPYGILLYSDLAQLSSAKIRKLIEQLVVLDQKSPCFRLEDWSEYTPSGLVTEDTVQSIEKVIVNDEIGSQLKQLLVEAIKDSKFAPVFNKSLTKILYNRGESYTVRLNALEILLEISECVPYWTKVIEKLRQQKFSDSTEFCIFILDKVGVNKFSIALVSECVLAETGFLRDRDRSGMLRVSSVYSLSNEFNVDRSIELLDRISLGVKEFMEAKDSEEMYDPSWECISSFCFPILERLYKANSLTFGKLIHWTKSIAPYGFSENTWRKGLESILSKDPDFRRELQLYLFKEPERRSLLDLFRFHFGEISKSLELSFEDTCFHIEQILKREKSNEYDQLIWTTLVKYRIYEIEELDCIRKLSQTYIEDKTGLQDVLAEQMKISLEAAEDQTHRISNTTSIYEERKMKRRSDQRELIYKNIEDFETGSTVELASCAKDYLGINRYENYYDSPYERVTKEVGSGLLNSTLKGFCAVLQRDDLPSSKEVADLYSSNRSCSYVYPILAGLSEYVRDSKTFEGISDEVLLVGYYVLRQERLIDLSIKEKLHAPLKKEVFERFTETKIYRRWMEPFINDGTFDYSDFISLTNNCKNPSVVIPMVMDWLQSYDTFSVRDTKKLVSDLLFQDQHFSSVYKEQLLTLSLSKIGSTANNNADFALFWASVVFYTDFERFFAVVPSKLKSDKNLIWDIRDTSSKQIFDDEDRIENVNLKISSTQLHWIVSNFRMSWDYIEYWPGAMAGDRNPWDASEYLQICIERLGREVDDDSRNYLDSLISKTSDGYTKCLLVAQSKQKRARIEHNFQPPTLTSIKNLLDSNIPVSPKDLQALFLASLDTLQLRINGDQANTINLFYTDSGKPKVENECRDAIISLLDGRDSLNLIPEYVAPNDTRADIGVIHGDKCVTVEVKGQWNRNLWDGVTSQLKRNYTKDYRTRGFGVYLVLWFGRKTCEGRYLKHPIHNPFFPAFKNGPSSASELNFMLAQQIPEGSKDLIRIYVLDLERKND